MSKMSVAEVLQLSVPERIAHTTAQREELDRRLEDYRQHSEEGSPWEEVRKRILSRGQ